MENVGWFAAAMAVIFLINLSPGFMPSSWMVMAFFYIQFGLPLVPLGIAGALVSGLGRLCLAQGSGWVTERFFPKKKEDLQSLGGYLERKRGLVAGFVFVYSLLPLPTNNLFLAAGMTRVNLAYVLGGFYAARLPADLFWVWTTSATFRSLDEVFANSGNLLAIALQAGALLSVALLYFLPWGKWLRHYIDSHPSDEGKARPQGASAGA